MIAALDGDIVPSNTTRTEIGIEWAIRTCRKIAFGTVTMPVLTASSDPERHCRPSQEG